MDSTVLDLGEDLGGFLATPGVCRREIGICAII